MPARSAGPQFPRPAAADRMLQYASSVIDQVVSDMPLRSLAPQLLCSRLREGHGFARDLPLTARTALRDFFDDMAVRVAGGEILAGVHPRRVFTQGLSTALSDST